MDGEAIDPAAAAGGQNVLTSIPDIFRSVVDLVTAGGNGLAAIIFVSVMIVMVASLVLGLRMSKDMVGLTKWYLVLGAVCVALSLSVSFIDKYFGATYDLHVSISPSLSTAGLPDPIIRADTLLVGLDQLFPVNDDVGINVIFDGIIAAVQKRDAALVQTVDQANEVVQANNQCNQALTQQSDQLQTLRASFETFKAAVDPAAPVWADSQIEALSLDFDTVNPVMASDFQQFDPLPLPDQILLNDSGIPL